MTTLFHGDLAMGCLPPSNALVSSKQARFFHRFQGINTDYRVPLDWADEEKGKISLAVIRLPAATQPREGYMFYNPGGPGASGLDLIAGMGAKFQSQLGQSWDIVSWDPRTLL